MPDDTPAVQAEEQVQGAVAEGQTPPETPPTPQATVKQQIEALLPGLTDEEIKELIKHPKIEKPFNAGIQSIGSRKARELQRELEIEQQEAQQAQSFLTQMNELARTNPGLAQNLLRDPATLQRYEEAQSKAIGARTTAIWANTVWGNIKKRMTEEPDFKDVPFDDLEKEHSADLVALITNLAKHATASERKKLLKEVEEQRKAMENEMKAKALEKEVEPELVPESEIAVGTTAWKTLPPIDKIALGLQEERKKQQRR